MLHVEHEERVVISVVTKRADNWLASAQLRPTKQRMALAEALVGDGHHRHVTAESLFERVQRTGGRVSLATVTTRYVPFVMLVFCKRLRLMGHAAILIRTLMITRIFIGKIRTN